MDLRVLPGDTKQGFTIVELLVVIVVIGILASITIIVYGGIQTRAHAAVLQSDLRGVFTQMNLYKTLHGEYPASLALLDEDKGATASPGTTYQYTFDNASNPKTFCITGKSDSVYYFMRQEGAASEGLCPGHIEEGVVSVPTRVGYFNFSGSYGSNTMTISPPDTIPVGSWMIIILAYNVEVDATPPGGWATLLPRVTTGTLQTALFAKIKDGLDPNSYTIGLPAGTNTTTGVLIWGGGASSIASWTVGPLGIRANNATSTTTVAPSVSAETDNSLILSISTERTSATETDISSIVGSTKWFFIPHPTSLQIQTIAVGYTERATPGAVDSVTVTYPNAQSVNALALQLVIPPAS